MRGASRLVGKSIASTHASDRPHGCGKLPVASAPGIWDAVKDTLRQFDLPEVTQQQVNDWIGHGTRELLIQALACSTRTEVAAVRVSDTLAGIAAAFDRYYQSRCGTRSHLYPQVRETLVALRKQGVKLAVVTNKEGRYTATVLTAPQLQPHPR